MAKKIGGNQRASRKSKIERLIGKRVTATFVFGAGESRQIVDVVDVREDTQVSKYFLKKTKLALPLKYIQFSDGYEKSFGVQVPTGSYLLSQLTKLSEADID